MSSPGYRDRRDFVPRGGGRGYGGRGRGGGFKARPRYWDNDDYYDKGRGGGKRRYSRSRSRSRSRGRSRSRSYSRSRSRSYSPRDRRRSRSRSRSRSNDSPAPRSSVAPIPSPISRQDPYVHQPMKDVDRAKWKTTGGFLPEYDSRLQTNGGAGGTDSNLMESMEQEFLQKQQLQKAYQQQHRASIGDDPSLTFGGYGSGFSNENILQQLYPQPSSLDGLNSAKPIQAAEQDAPSSKKKKEKRKKKKSRRRSSSSSSSSSSDSSGSGARRKRKSKRDSDDDSSNSSSENEVKPQKQKEKPAPAETGSRLTDEQRQALIKQHDSYKEKKDLIERETAKLITKEDELRRTRADIRLVEENLKLQTELKGRCKAVVLVLEKINNVLVADKIGTEKSHPPVPPPPPTIREIREISKPVQLKLSKKDLLDVDYIDNGKHWCRLCNVFPESAEQMLKHFHSQAHRDQVEQLGIEDKPWNKRDVPSIEQPPSTSATKLPLRGMQFFSPVEGWYCRLCNIWMGDHQMGTTHLRSLEHNTNYMTFLEDHPNWETKWTEDREKARLRSLGEVDQRNNKGSRFHTHGFEDDNAGSIRVQMRNTIKVEETKQHFVSKTDSKDVGMDEWMGKPQKAPLDTVDTQKFAEIVRQRHGAVRKEEEAVKLRDKDKESNSIELSTSQQKTGRDVGSSRDDVAGRDVDKRRVDLRVEMQISSRENRDRDRMDRIREIRGSGGRRRETRDRSRSRSRDRGYHSRRRSRSRSRSRDRRDLRDKSTREPIKKQMPIIGKMPLYKRPLNTGKDKPEEPTNKSSIQSTVSHDAVYESMPPSDPITADHHHEQNTYGGESSSYSHNMSAVSSSYETTMDHSTLNYSADVSAHSIEDARVFVPVDEVVAMVPRPDNDLKPPGEKEAPGGTNLPDDLQQALDIIYRGQVGGKPITIPPPNFNASIPPPGMMGVPPPSAQPTYGHDYSSMSYYEPSYKPPAFDGYGHGTSDMEEIAVAGNVSVMEKMNDKNDNFSSSVPYKTVPQAQPENGDGGDDDDMDDLRMLGIDVDDVAVVRK